ncbi:MAG: hypothetical protein A3D28_04940 [Omnitrophica bacterium RIFCSPHIGHO2_02_FULL_63_14]|nr:MAG: hypothetical protein A3D28_04940 [Omnitrophica bacterium RIFCSPHIGHO2_02_FULL_63_14]
MPRHERLFPRSLAILVALTPLDTFAAEQNDRHFARDLVRAATYTVEAYTSVFFQTFPSTPTRIVDDKAVVFWTKGTAKSQATLCDGLSVKAALLTVYSGYDDERRGVFASPDSEAVYSRYVDFKELSLRYDQKAFAVTLGKAPITVGLSTLYSPANRYRVLDTSNPMQPEDLGVWQASLDWFLGDNTLRFSVLPVEAHSLFPHGSSRWLGEFGAGFNHSSSGTSAGLGSGGAVGLTLPAEVTARAAFRNRLGSLLKFSGVATGVDYFAAAHYGPSIFPALQNSPQNEFVIETPAAATFSGGATATRGALEIHGESAYQLADGNDDQDFVKYVIGAAYRETVLAERLGLDEITPVIEYAGEWTTDEQDNPGLTVPSEEARPFRNSLLFKIDLMPSDKLTCTIGGIRNFSTDDRAYAMSIEYKPDYNLTFRVAAVAFDGETDTPFGLWDRNDHIAFGVKRTF